MFRINHRDDIPKMLDKMKVKLEEVKKNNFIKNRSLMKQIPAYPHLMGRNSVTKVQKI